METVADSVVLADSNAKTRPDTFIFYRQDYSNEKPTSKNTTHVARLRLPKLEKNKELLILQEEEKKDDFKGREAMIQKSKESVTDPLSGCMSQVIDVPRQENKCLIKSFTVKSYDPQHLDPREVNSIRVNMPHAPVMLQRRSENDPPLDGLWNTKVVSNSISGRLGGWTVTVDPRVTGEIPWGKSQAFPTYGKLTDPSQEMTPQQKNALKYIYTSATQRAYQDVPFDSMVGKKKWPPTTTLEAASDPLRVEPFSARFDPPAREWKEFPDKAPGWDFQQMRFDYYNVPRPHDFCADRKRGQQIPTYSGFIGAYKPEQLDNPYVKPFQPLTCVRTEAPKFSYMSQEKFPFVNRKDPLGATKLSPPWATDFRYSPKGTS